MAESQLQKFRRRYPEFAEVCDWSNAKVLGFIEDAKEEMSETVWSNLYEKGYMALAAHLMAVSKAGQVAANNPALAGGGAGAVTFVKTGEEQIMYAVTSQTQGTTVEQAALMSTRYGQEYVRLRELVSGHPVILGGC